MRLTACGGADYIDFLHKVTPDNQEEYMLQMRRFNMGAVGEADCPVFDGLFDYCAVRLTSVVYDGSAMRSGSLACCLSCDIRGALQ